MQNYKRSKLNELGSLMIEAMAMLALISMVTPILYKKSAERTTELQDINAASEIRSLIKSLDDYVSDHYNDILQGKTVTQNCKTASVNFSDMKETTTASTQKKTININHFCEYLPYGFLDKDKEAQSTKTFSKNYKVVFKKVDGGNGRKRVITAFLITEPSDGGTFPKLRASRIASMIGSNGGYLNVSGGTASAMGTQGIWSVDNIATDLGVAANTVKDGAIIASSVQGIASQGGVDNDEVLYRKYRTNRALNTMETDLLMGTSEALGNNITRVNQMIIAAGRPANFAENANDAESALYIKNGGATIKSGIKAADGKFVVDNEGNTKAVSFLAGNFSAQQDLLQLGDGNLGLNATNSGFTLDYEDTTTWNATTGLGSAPINLNSDTKIDGNLHVTKNAYVGKDLRVNGTIDSDKLHARTQLTVGGTPEYPSYLKVASDGALFKQSKFVVGGTAVTDATARLYIDANNTTLRSLTTAGTTGNLTLEGGASATLQTKNEAGAVTIQSGTGGTVIGSGGSIAIKSAVATGQGAAETPVIINEGMMTFYRNAGKIESIVNSFLVTSSADGAIYGYINPGEKEFSMGDMALYVRDPDDADVFTVDPKTTNQGTARMRGKFSVVNNDTPATESDPLVAGKTVFQVNPDNQQDAATANNATVTVDSNYLKVSNMTDNKRFLTIDIKEGLKDKTVTEKGSVYIRKGVLELETNPAAVTSEQDGTTYSNQGYVKADRFVANKALESEAIARPRDFGTLTTGGYDKYQVNPAYTSVMHDIKLTTRGGARLSDILPDFINKGIYIVDNTYDEASASGWNNTTTEFDPTKSYDDCGTNAACVASPWMGFVPTPTCPPGYMKVITLTPATFAMAQAGVPGPLPSGPGAKKNVDLIIDYNVRDPNEYVDGYTGTAHYNKSSYVTTAPTPLYFQKNTWLRSMVKPYPATNTVSSFKGWSAIMGFVYPYNYYQKYITLLGLTPAGAGESTVIWNLFPVYNQTLEGYATVYCYFNRAEGIWDTSLVDTTYDQLNSFRNPNSKSRGSGATADNKLKSYVNRLNDPTLNYKDPW